MFFVNAIQRSMSFSSSKKFFIMSILMGTLAFSVAAVPASATVVEVIEQLLNSSQNSPNVFRQTFTPTVSGYITEVAVETNFGANPGLLNIIDGNGVGAVLTSESVTWVDNTFQNVVLTNPVAVTAGQVYTLEATETGLRSNFSPTDAYAGGETWIFRSDLGGVWQSWTDCAISGWCAQGHADMTFRVTIEDSVVANEESTWGSLKAIYR